MSEKVEIPGGKNELSHLLYPFYEHYPKKLFSKFRWWKNKQLQKKLSYLNSSGKWITVINRLGARGDTLITANVIRCIKEKYKNLKINCITPYQELLENNPFIDSINCPETFYSFDSSYFELLVRNEKNENVVAHNLRRLGIKEYDYKSSFFLSNTETEWAKKKIKDLSKPLISISTRSNEELKNWPVRKWVKMINEISERYKIIHLGDGCEPSLNNVIRYAGNCTMRESAALLSHSQLFIGPDSLLMHVANGLNIKSIIIYGDARPVNCLGYPENINISLPSAKDSSSWLRLEEVGQTKSNMSKIKVQTIINHINLILGQLPSRQAGKG